MIVIFWIFQKLPCYSWNKKNALKAEILQNMFSFCQKDVAGSTAYLSILQCCDQLKVEINQNIVLHVGDVTLAAEDNQ